MKIAIVHEFLTQFGGAERVLEVISEIFPDTPIHVLFYDREKVKGFESSTIKTSFLQTIPAARKHFKWFLPLMPAATEHFNLSEYDLVISSSSAFAKGIITGPETLHICYCHTPTRYLWTDTHEYIESLKYNAVVKRLIPLYLNRLRTWDYLAAQRVDFFVANSVTVQKRIKKYYHRDSDVIYPPVDTHHFQPRKALDTESYYITGGRLVPYKHFDLTIEAFNKMKKPLKVFGVGPEFEKLKKLAGPTVEILGRVDDAQLRELYEHAEAFIHPQLEDFGITPIESMAAGRPVIGYAQGGLTETVIDGITGVFFYEQNVDALIQAVRIFETKTFDPEKIKEHAQQYSTQQFKKKFKQYVLAHYDEFKKQQ